MEWKTIVSIIKRKPLYSISYLILIIGLLFEFMIYLNIMIATDDFWAPYVVMLLQILFSFLFEIVVLILLIIMIFKHFKIKDYLPFLINSLGFLFVVISQYKVFYTSKKTMFFPEIMTASNIAFIGMYIFLGLKVVIFIYSIMALKSLAKN